jgi:hypothetical protein
MLTKEDNDRLTQVGPGTPSGELLRRFWHPIAPVQELTGLQATIQHQRERPPAGARLGELMVTLSRTRDPGVRQEKRHG